METKAKRNYFQRARDARAVREFRDSVEEAKPPAPDCRGKKVLAQVVERKQHVVMNAAEAARQAGRSKGGTIVQTTGTGHRFTSETGRKAVLRRWRKTYKRKPGSGGTHYVKLARRPPIDREGVRKKYTRMFRGFEADLFGFETDLIDVKVGDVWFDPSENLWKQVRVSNASGYLIVTISERSAFKHLGLTRFDRKGHVPISVKPFGTTHASRE